MFILAAALVLSAHVLDSPDGRTRLTVDVGDALTWSVSRNGQPVTNPSRIALDVQGRGVLGARPVIGKVHNRAQNRSLKAPFYVRRAEVQDNYRELAVELRDGLGVSFRAYDDGVAYRLRTDLPGEIVINDEIVELRFDGNPTAWVGLQDCSKTNPGADCFHSSYEFNYTTLPLAELDEQGTKMVHLPALFDGGAGRPKVLVTESDLDDYPGLWLRPVAGAAAVTGTFARYPLAEKEVGAPYPSPVVTQRASYIARTRGTRQYPWRVLALADRDVDLVATDIVYRLAGEPTAGDWSWIKPGKSQSEWISDNTLYGVDFEAGYNTATYEHYIDFCKTFNLGYIFFDAGWSDVRDTSKITSTMDVRGLIRQARRENLGVVLWTNVVAIRGNIGPVLDRLRDLGANGLMVDFMNRDDQPIVRFYSDLLREAAERHLVVSFHGAYKPTGLERRFPNAVDWEAGMGFEFHKWSDKVTPEHEVTLPFIRGVVGPFDYEPGGMRNAQKKHFCIVSHHPMSQGTRIHQLAMFVVYETAFAKLGGNVSDYRREPEFTRFIGSIPTVWRETRALDGKLGDYVVLMRTAFDGSIWIAAMTDWEARRIELPLEFLGAGEFAAEIYRDGLNAAHFAIDYRREEKVVSATEKLSIPMAPGGGFVARLTKK